jgi:hypothetical protein
MAELLGGRTLPETETLDVIDSEEFRDRIENSQGSPIALLLTNGNVWHGINKGLLNGKQTYDKESSVLLGWQSESISRVVSSAKKFGANQVHEIVEGTLSTSRELRAANIFLRLSLARTAEQIA